MLKVKINRIEPRAYGVNFNLPGLFGQFPDDFPDGQVKYLYLDLECRVTEFPPGIEEMPLAPFPGTLSWRTREPGWVPARRARSRRGHPRFDLKKNRYFPVLLKGALLWSQQLTRSEAAMAK